MSDTISDTEKAFRARAGQAVPTHVIVGRIEDARRRTVPKPSPVYGRNRFEQGGIMPSAHDVLLAERQPFPAWLRTGGPLVPEIVNCFFSSRVVFYPGSGTDGHAFQVFCGSHSACCVVHADWNVGLETVSRELEAANPHRLAGYSAVHHDVLSIDVLQRHLETAFDPPPVYEAMPEPPVAFPSRSDFALWAVLQRDREFDDSHGPNRIAFLHIRAEAVWTYWNLWGSRRCRPPYAVILQDHGFGGNPWVHFGGTESPLYQIAAAAGLPDWLLVAENTDPWPRYSEASDWSQPAGARHHRRRLFRRT